MDNDYKVSWIDTNPQNSSYKNEYFAKNKISKKISSQDIEDIEISNPKQNVFAFLKEAWKNRKEYVKNLLRPVKYKVRNSL